MKIAAVLSVALSIAFYGAPTSASWIISTIDDLGNYVTEDLDAPISDDYILGLGLVLEKNLRYMLYTRENKIDPYQLISGDKKNLNASPFNPNRPTKFLVHGWQSSYAAGPLQLVKSAFLDNEDCNVIMLDYKKYNAPYVIAFSNAKALGRHFAAFVTFLIKNGGLKPVDIHIIGHSLGAHVSGFLAKNLRGKVARVTGLDPAGPLFPRNRPADRLASTDAVYVDTIQSSTLAGIHKSIGQVNFYPNGGSNQPACKSSPLPPACDHVYAWEYFEISIGDRDAFPARVCADEEEAEVADSFANKCIPSLAVMGDDAIKKSPVGDYYVDVSTHKR